jgi:DNA-binding MarR family transcriptional regulator
MERTSALESFNNNLVYFCDNSNAEEFKSALFDVYDEIESRKLMMSNSFFESIDFVIRQLYNSSLIAFHDAKDFVELHKSITAAEYLFEFAEERTIKEKFLNRWEMVIELVNDRQKELHVDIHAFAKKPQIKQILSILLTSEKSTNDLKNELGVSKQRLSNILRELKSMLLIEEKASPVDARKKYYSISNKARRELFPEQTMAIANNNALLCTSEHISGWQPLRVSIRKLGPITEYAQQMAHADCNSLGFGLVATREDNLITSANDVDAYKNQVVGASCEGAPFYLLNK